MAVGWWRGAQDADGRGEVTGRLRQVLERVWVAYRRLLARHRAERQAWAAERTALLGRATKAEERAAEAEEQLHQVSAVLGKHVRARFGRRTEQAERKREASTATEAGKPAKGQQRGKRGHGRRPERYAGLPVVDEEHDVREQDKYCENCGTARVQVADDVAGEVEVRLVVELVRHHRKTYVRACGCAGTPIVVRGPVAPKLIPRCSLSCSTISFCVCARYLLGLPLHRITTMLAYHGAPVPDGTLVGVFKAVHPLLQPLYEAIRERNRHSPYLHADETTWRQLWVSKGKRGYVWCFAGPDTTVYLFDTGRDHSVVLRYLGLEEGAAWGGQMVDLICDFLGSYDKAARLANAPERRVALSRCWTHYRRLFLDIPARYPGDRRVQAEVAQWQGMIADLFRLHHERDMAADGSLEQELAQAAFRGCLQEMEEIRARQLRRRKLAPELRHVLDFGAQHWEELIRPAADPHHPIDNNFAERQIRLPVIIRKNAYGSGALWAADEACQVWTIGRTAQQNGRNPWSLIAAYLQACAQAGGKVPPDWERFLPWNWSEEPSQDAAATPHAIPATAVPPSLAQGESGAGAHAEATDSRVLERDADVPATAACAASCDDTAPAPLSSRCVAAMEPCQAPTVAVAPVAHDLSGEMPAAPDPGLAKRVGTPALRPATRARTPHGAHQREDHRRSRTQPGRSSTLSQPP